MPQAPLVAVVSNSLTPYRLHLHDRIVREMTEIRLASLFTHSESNSAWAQWIPERINPVSFGPDEPSANQGRLRFAGREWRKGGRMIRWLREHDARAVVVLGYNDPGRIRLLRWSRRNGLPCFLFGDSNIRGDNATGLKRRFKSAVVSRVVRWSTGILYCGSLGRQYFARYGAKPGHSFPFPYEPDYDKIQSLSQSQVAAAAEKYQFTSQRKRVLYCGRLAPEKRVDLLLASFSAMADARPDWDLVIVGTGPLEQILKSSVPPSLTHRIQWLGFFDDQDAVSAIYRNCDLLVLPSDFEPWAVVINEALAAGLAVIASDNVGAAADLVRPGVNGLIFPHGDGDALSESLMRATAPETIVSMKNSAAGVLADWRRDADPIDGLRRALRSAGIIS